VKLAGASIRLPYKAKPFGDENSAICIPTLLASMKLKVARSNCMLRPSGKPASNCQYVKLKKYPEGTRAELALINIDIEEPLGQIVPLRLVSIRSVSGLPKPASGLRDTG